MVVLAPISQSSPITTPPSCGTLSQRPASIARPKPSAPSTAPGWMSTRWPRRTRVDQGDARDQLAAGADHAVVADHAARAEHRAGVDAAARADADERTDAGAADRRCALGVDRPRWGARPASRAACGSNSAAISREGGVGIARDQRGAPEQPSASSSRITTTPAPLPASWLRYAGLARNASWLGAGRWPACRRRPRATAPSPCSSRPKRSASSAAVSWSGPRPV